MPSETLSHGPWRSYSSLEEAVVFAIESAIAGRDGYAGEATTAAPGALGEGGTTSTTRRVTLSTRLEELGLDEIDLLEIVDSVVEELGERGIAPLDGSELGECETVGDLVSVIAASIGLEGEPER